MRLVTKIVTIGTAFFLYLRLITKLQLCRYQDASSYLLNIVRTLSNPARSFNVLITIVLKVRIRIWISPFILKIYIPLHKGIEYTANVKMNFSDLFVKVLHLLGLGGGTDSGTTTISTVDDYFSSRLTSTIVYDTSTLAKLHSTTVSPKFISTLASTYSTVDEIIDRSKTVTATGITQEIDTTKSSVPSTTFEPTVTEISSTASETTETGGSSTTSGTTDTGSNTETVPTGETGSSTTVTDKTDPNTSITGVTGNETTTDITGVTKNETTVTEVTTKTTVTGVTGNETTITGTPVPVTTVTGSTASDQPGSTTPGSTDVTPTKAPGLSRGAVAGIVIGCLLLVAVVAAAVVFFMKNRNIPPEAQRLRV